MTNNTRCFLNAEAKQRIKTMESNFKKLNVEMKDTVREKHIVQA